MVCRLSFRLYMGRFASLKIRALRSKDQAGGTARLKPGRLIIRQCGLSAPGRAASNKKYASRAFS
jgi:hypothetical protein